MKPKANQTPPKPKVKKGKKVDVKNLKKVVQKIDGLATSDDIAQLRNELLVEQRRNKFEHLPPRLKLKVLRSLSKGKKN